MAGEEAAQSGLFLRLCGNFQHSRMLKSLLLRSNLLRLKEMEFVLLHIHAASTECNALGSQAETLLES